ncbi:MAG: ATP-binding protein [Desulfobacula sp.]|nr:ATP-binding protein [Desulfobacula sp.]
MEEPVGMDTSTMASGKIQLSIPSHPQYLQLVRGVVKKATGIIGVSRKDSDHIILAVDEACSNIIKHSYMNNPEKTIDISIGTQGKELHILITDYGKKCDIRQLLPRDIDIIRPGGLGLYIINHAMDSVEYDCSASGKNQVRMIKCLKKSR